MTAYSEKLKDPRWQRVRLEVMQAADWKCVCCGAADRTLAVHHLEYSGEPWEAPREWLECLCEDCHEWREAYNRLAGRSLLPTALVRSLLVYPQDLLRRAAA